MAFRPLFVLGAQRSGTTIVGGLLAEHRAIYLTLEGKLLYYLISWVGRDPHVHPGWHLRLDEIAYSLGRRPIRGVKSEDIHKMLQMLESNFPAHRFLQSSSSEIVREIWTEIYAELAIDKLVAGDKFPEYLLQLPEIVTIFPNARFIFIHRNPWDVADSATREFRGEPWAPSISMAIAKWASWNQMWLNARGSIAADNRFEIAYEGFVTYPEETFISVCRFLDVPCTHDYLVMIRERTRKDRLGSGRKLPMYWHEAVALTPELPVICSQLGYGMERVMP